LSCKRASTLQQPCISKLLPNNGRSLRLHHSVFQPSCHNIYIYQGRFASNSAFL
jgi:hypothetical protein